MYNTKMTHSQSYEKLYLHYSDEDLTQHALMINFYLSLLIRKFPCKIFLHTCSWFHEVFHKEWDRSCGLLLQSCPAALAARLGRAKQGPCCWIPQLLLTEITSVSILLYKYQPLEILPQLQPRSSSPWGKQQSRVGGNAHWAGAVLWVRLWPQACSPSAEVKRSPECCQPGSSVGGNEPTCRVLC